MSRSLTSARTAVLALALAVSATLPSTGRAAAGDAKGTMAHKARRVNLAHAYLVTGPDGLDPKKTVRRIILSAKDIGAKVRACQTMSCVDGELMDGLVVDIDGGPRLNYWMTVNNQLVQHSGTKPPSALKASADGPKRLAGKLAFDDAQSGGPMVEVEFDAPLVKEFKAAR